MGRPKELSEEERRDLIAKGYRPVEIWVPDLDNPKMLEELEKQARAVAEADEKDDIFEWLEGVHALDASDSKN